jgi:hypothetical protein
MSTSNSTIVVVPGACHSPIRYRDLTISLIDAGYPTVSGTLPSLNPPVPNLQTVSHDAGLTRNNLLGPLLSEGKDVVLVICIRMGVLLVGSPQMDLARLKEVL